MIDVTKFPLIVDLDGTLAKVDGLIDGAATIAIRRPLSAFAAFASLQYGRASFKDFLADIGAYPVSTMPLRAELVSWLKEQRASGREIHLVTASPQSVADGIAQRLGDLFTSSTGSSGGSNLKGNAKATYLEERFPEGFVYAGNDANDLEVWRKAIGIITVDATAEVRSAAHRLGPPVERDFPGDPASWRTWVRLMRIHQWAKNGLMFVPLLLAHRYTDVSAILTLLAGFACMGLVASATYIFNDLGDLESDRQHPTKSQRPLASAAISAKSAVQFGLVIGLGGFVGATLLSPAFVGILLIYVCLTLSYSIKLKSIALLDVFLLGMLYMLRIYMGTVLVGLDASPWLLVFSLFFFFSLSMAKRHVEIVKAVEAGQSGRIKGRGYNVRDEPVTLALGVSSSLAAVLLLLLYVVNDAFPANFYNSPKWLWVIGPLVFLWCSRIWLKSHRGELDDDPVVFALKDRPSWVLGLAVLAVFIFAVR